MQTKFTGSSPEEVSTSLASASLKLKQAQLAETRFKKLHTIMASIGISSTRQRKLTLINSSINFIDRIDSDTPKSLKRDLRIIQNELSSLADGIRANLVTPEDMFLTSSLQASLSANKLVSSIQASIGRIDPSQVTSADATPSSEILKNNSKYKSLLPDLTKKDFGAARVPVTFSIMPSSGHTTVGYLDQDMLSHLGFKSKLLDGYAIVYDQLVVGISRSMVLDYKEVSLEDGSIQKQSFPKIVTDRVTKFTNSKPGMVSKKRPKSILDAFHEVKGLLERHTNTKYSLVSEKSHGYNGQSYFWLMPSRDLVRFARVFPGGHVGIHAWGFAF